MTPSFSRRPTAKTVAQRLENRGVEVLPASILLYRSAPAPA